ncbi:MAG: HAD hydrolase-like protein [Bacteroidales bacterium]|jgi:phosphoglycolate phosphatase-like HAD superfamily hydrolase|nr:HAD hydrolase-like protein [Bacteroidales bacterium]
MQGKIKYIVLDFDGTMADTIDLALNIYDRIAPEYDCLPIGKADRKQLGRRRLQDLLREYGISRLKLVLIVLRIRKEMGKRISELKPVKGIRDSLQEIKDIGFNLGILTSNSKENVKMFLENNDLSDKIDFIYSGKSLFGKDKVMTRLFDHEGISREELIYVGDEIRDMEASVKAGIKAIAVSWGLCRWENQDTLQPEQVAHSPGDLITCIQEIVTNKKFT